MEWNFIFAFIFCSLAVLINICAISILYKTKKINRSRFYFLTLLLSISDATVAVYYLLHTIINYLNTGSDAFLYGCILLKHVIGGAFGFSLFQTVMICLERLQATFVTKKKILRKLTSNKTVGMMFVVFQIYTFAPFIVAVVNGPEPCTVDYTKRSLYVLTIDIPILLCLCFVVCLYTVVILRVMKKQRSVGQVLDTSKTHQTSQSLRKLKRNMVTLGILVGITSVTFVPREIIAFYASSVEAPGKLLMQLLLISNYLPLINPLIDPLVYVLRFQEISRLFRCPCDSNSVIPINVITAVSSRYDNLATNTQTRDLSRY